MKCAKNNASLLKWLKQNNEQKVATAYHILSKETDLFQTAVQFHFQKFKQCNPIYSIYNHAYNIQAKFQFNIQQ